MPEGPQHPLTGSFLAGRLRHEMSRGDLDYLEAMAGRHFVLRDREVEVDHAAIGQAFETRPALARALWFASLLDAAIHRRWIQMLEQHDAPRRIAHIYCELHTRLAFTGRAEDGMVRAPFTQFDLADMCGVSAVHANRAVAKLREMELAEIRRGTLYANDWGILQHYAQFDPAYLFGAELM